MIYMLKFDSMHIHSTFLNFLVIMAIYGKHSVFQLLWLKHQYFYKMLDLFTFTNQIKEQLNT